MKALLLALTLSASLVSCQSLDGKLADLTTKVQKYCTTLETAAQLAEVVANKSLVTKINLGIASYCNSEITDVPSAIIALANIMKAVNAAGINP